ncbi:hypothetical protein NDU88_004193 [Pleurodeles waltl]|uniref:Secreted protein n=1 Tax=Pleurodeles waltl TaxID=8319 RepID=A0AAV7KYR1_PLEWA|nr:hypothetical protein NDU88_004193 [Pleurodeles waltl]
MDLMKRVFRVLLLASNVVPSSSLNTTAVLRLSLQSEASSRRPTRLLGASSARASVINRRGSCISLD